MFCFLWRGAHSQGGPSDVTKILAQELAATQRPDSPLRGPLHAPYYWGESLFSHDQTDEAGVLRKHARMLGDAGHWLQQDAADLVSRTMVTWLSR